MLGELCSFEEALDPDSGANLEPEKLKKIAENKKWLDDHWQEVEQALLKKQEELRNDTTFNNNARWFVYEITKN